MRGGDMNEEFARLKNEHIPDQNSSEVLAHTTNTYLRREDMSFIESQDPKIFETIEAELDRQNNNIELIASENFVSEAVMEAQGSILTNKYAEGYPHKRYYGGCENVDVVEDLARERVKSLFGAEHANVQPTHGSPVNFSGKLSKEVFAKAKEVPRNCR